MKLAIAFGIFSLLFIKAYPAYAQESVIERVLEARQSIVHIKAVKTQIAKAPQAQAAIDPNTGRIVVARNIKAGYLQKTGAGVILNSQGVIATNLHTIYESNLIYVKLYDNSTLTAQIIKLMPNEDLALIKVDPPFALRPIEFANSNTIELGDDVVNIGTSSMLQETLSGGKITSIMLDKHRRTIELIQVNLNLYKGDSGGPLLNDRGRLIGMISAELTNKKRATFAIPSNKIKKLYRSAGN